MGDEKIQVELTRSQIDKFLYAIDTARPILENKFYSTSSRYLNDLAAELHRASLRKVFNAAR